MAYVPNSRDGVIYAPSRGHDVNRINLDAIKGKLRFTGIEGLDAQLTLSIMRDLSDTRSFILVNQPGTLNPRLP